MTESRTVAFVPLLLAALQGCISVPAPVDVVQSCNREQTAIRGDMHGSPRNYHEKVQARCVDDQSHLTVAVVEKRAAENRRSAYIQYEDRDGAERTQVSATGSSDEQTVKQEVHKKRENKYFIWGWSWGVEVAKPRR